MKINSSNNLPRELAAGGFAGLIGGFALAGAAQIMYNLTSEQKKEEERKIEPRNPFIVLADNLQNLTGIELNEQQKKVFEQCTATTVGVAAGVAYAALARTSNLNWLAKGTIFGTLFWAVEDEGMGTAMGLAGDNTKYPVEAHVRGLVAHVAFGVVTAAIHQACMHKDK
jgi:hypothetical protein